MLSIRPAALTFANYASMINRTATSPVIIHVPHAGTAVPAGVRGQFPITDAELAAEHLHLVDHATDKVASHALKLTDASALINALSRTVVDVERFDGPDEEKNAVGMGVLYTHGAHRTPIREVPTDTAALMSFYRDYSDAMTCLVDSALAAHGRAVIIDLHSYNTVPLPHELHTHEPRPQLCVGFEDLHLSAVNRELVRNAFAWLQQGDNETFHGAYVPRKHYRRDARVQSFMLEIRRDQYLDETTGRARPEQVLRLGDSLAALIGMLSSTPTRCGETTRQHPRPDASP